MATMKTLNGYGFNATELNGKAASDYLQKTDTATNSAKLGGKAPEYYIQPRNLLDNSDFRNPVNQRGATSYSGIWVYSIDRWVTWLDTSNSATVSVINGGITPYPGMVIQRIESKHIDSSKIYTLAAMTGDGLLVLSGKITSTSKGSTNANNGIYFEYNADNDVYQFTLAGLTSASKFVWAALYEGSYTTETLPPYVPKGYAMELAECQRYYRKSYVGSSIPTFADGGVVTLRPANTNWLCTVVFDKPMRIAPTVTVYSAASKAAGKVTRFSDDADIDVTILEDENGFCCLKESAFDANLAYQFSYTASADL